MSGTTAAFKRGHFNRRIEVSTGCVGNLCDRTQMKGWEPMFQKETNVGFLDGFEREYGRGWMDILEFLFGCPGANTEHTALIRVCSVGRREKLLKR